MHSYMVWYAVALPCFALLLAVWFLRRQRIATDENPKMKLYDAKGKTILITGASSGIGKATTLQLAKCDARIIMACRDRKRTEDAVYEIRKKTNKGNLVIQLVDLSSFKSIDNFVKKIKETESHIDVLINNAGVVMPQYSETEDGHEMTIGVNHFAHFYLTLQLLPLLLHAEPSRIISLGSLTYKNAKINFDDIYLKQEYAPMRAYGQSKLANTLFSNYLKDKLKDTNIIVTTVSPGMVNTNIFSNWIGQSKVFKALKLVVGSIFLRTALQGSEMVVFASLDPALEERCGKFYRNCQELKLLPHALNKDDIQKLWEITESLTEIKSEKYFQNIIN